MFNLHQAWPSKKRSQNIKLDNKRKCQQARKKFKQKENKKKKRRNKQKATLHNIPQSILTIPGLNISNSSPVIRVQLTTVAQFCSHT